MNTRNMDTYYGIYCSRLDFIHWFCNLIENLEHWNTIIHFSIYKFYIYNGLEWCVKNFEKSIQKILDQAEKRWPLLAIHVVHRVGTMAPSEQIVLVMVASAHRDAAFAGAQYVMDCLKTEAVFWKNEQSDLGQGWVESTDADKVRAKLWNK